MEEYKTVSEMLVQAGPYIIGIYSAVAAPYLVYAIRKAMVEQNERIERLKASNARRDELEASFESRHGKKATLTNVLDELVKKYSDFWFKFYFFFIFKKIDNSISL